MLKIDDKKCCEHNHVTFFYSRNDLMSYDEYDLTFLLVLLNLSNSLRKSDKMLGMSRILSPFLNSFNKFNKT